MLFLSLSGVLASCSLFGDKNIHYDYEKPRQKTEKGTISVSFNPRARPAGSGGSATVIWSDPYHFNVQYESPVARGVCRGVLRNVRIRVAGSTDVVAEVEQFEDVDSHRRQDSECRRDTDFVLLGFGFSIAKMPYEDMDVSFDFEVFKSGTEVFDEGSIEVTVQRNEFVDYK